MIYAGYESLVGSAWGFGHETARHAVRLMLLSGLFDRHPRVQVIVGHLAEGLPRADEPGNCTPWPADSLFAQAAAPCTWQMCQRSARGHNRRCSVSPIHHDAHAFNRPEEALYTGATGQVNKYHRPAARRRERRGRTDHLAHVTGAVSWPDILLQLS